MRKPARWIRPVAVALLIMLVTGLALPAFGAPEPYLDVLISFRERPGSAALELIEKEGGKVNRGFEKIPAVSATVPSTGVDNLRRSSQIASVEPDIIVQAIGDTVPWGVQRVGARLFAGQNKGRGVRIAILDTGIDLDHPDLNVAGNVSFIPGVPTGDDDSGHGTMVAGIIAALDNGVGVVGVAPEASIYAVKVLNSSGSGAVSCIVSGIEWAINNGMQVINMSFGGSMGLPDEAQAALARASAAGIVLVAGAGNGGEGVIWAPGRYQPVIAVGAIDQQDARAAFSGTGAGLSLMAPGVDVLTTTVGGGYGNGSGTSYSTAHVSGLAALLIASGVYPTGVRGALQGTAKDLGTAGWDEAYGYGLANVAPGVQVNNLPDTLAPTVSIEFGGRQGNGGWYLSDVTAKLIASDDISGVAEVQFSLDDGATWQRYQSPVDITGEGTTVVCARARDYAGNTGILVRKQVNIDKTAPALSISATPELLPNNGKMVDVSVNASVADAASGVGSYNITVRDEYGVVEPVIGTQLQAQIRLEAKRDGNDADGRTYTISITATASVAGPVPSSRAVSSPPTARMMANPPSTRRSSLCLL